MMQWSEGVEGWDVQQNGRAGRVAAILAGCARAEMSPQCQSTCDTLRA